MSPLSLSRPPDAAGPGIAAGRAIAAITAGPAKGVRVV